MHLGEGTSLLTFPQGRKQLIDALMTKFGGEKIEESILVGDATDTSLTKSTSSASAFSPQPARIRTTPPAKAIKNFFIISPFK